jgi:CDP-diacylglycerol--glycerol-3-phosphate 3-phosphatidyltransferase
MANIITGIRIVISALMLFCPAFSPTFFLLYIAAGASDMIDGAVARKTGTVSAFGSRLDTIADIVFTAVCLIKMLPVLEVPVWLSVWIAVIAFVKAANIAAGYIRQKEFVAVHSAINKVTGGLLFVFPLTLALIDLKYSAAFLCAVATAAAVYEGFLMRTGRTEERQIPACRDSGNPGPGFRGPNDRKPP